MNFFKSARLFQFALLCAGLMTVVMTSGCTQTRMGGANMMGPPQMRPNMMPPNIMGPSQMGPPQMGPPNISNPQYAGGDDATFFPSEAEWNASGMR